jgi:hypothetical protein
MLKATIYSFLQPEFAIEDAIPNSLRDIIGLDIIQALHIG